MCVLVYNLESYEFFYMGICRSLCHSFNFVDMRFVVTVIFFPIKFYRKIYGHGKFLEFCCFFFFSHIFPWMDKFLFTENNFLPCSINRKVTVPRIFQSVYTLNICSKKNLPKECCQSINYAIS